jgi:hypothetical protein
LFPEFELESRSLVSVVINGGLGRVARRRLDSTETAHNEMSPWDIVISHMSITCFFCSRPVFCCHISSGVPFIKRYEWRAGKMIPDYIV